ncbi:hypothetical protein HY493_02545 [Candidatus Woesearchaeota archaeon]|nr:hypothetical protein [Candidatus Woesearchaeota archaeon]
MSYITRNANLILLFLIIIISGSLVGATVYFQDRFTDVNEEYDQKLAELKNVTEQVETYRDVLQKAQLELELKQSREEQFTEKYTETKATAEELAQTKAELEKDVRDLTTQVNSLTLQVTGLQSSLNIEKAKVANLQDDNADLQDKVDCLESTADSSESNC